MRNDKNPRPQPMDNGLTLPPLLTPEQVAEYLGIPVRRLYAWRLDGKGPKFVKVGHNLRYRTSDIGDYVEQNLRGPSTS